jgi:hypothetical protein
MSEAVISGETLPWVSLFLSASCCTASGMKNFPPGRKACLATLFSFSAQDDFVGDVLFFKTISKGWKRTFFLKHVFGNGMVNALRGSEEDESSYRWVLKSSKDNSGPFAKRSFP